MSEPFSKIPQEQLPSHCAPTSLSSCLAILGIDASQRDLARAAGKRWSVYRDGLDEHEIRTAAQQFGARCEFVAEFDKKRGAAFMHRVRAHLDRHLPAMLSVGDFSHWIALVGYLAEKKKFVVMDPNDDDRAFARWSERRFLDQAWNEGDEDEPSQRFAILVDRADGKPAKWWMTQEFIRLCAVGSADTAETMADDMREMVARSGGEDPSDVPLEDVLSLHRRTIVRSVDHWCAQHEVRKRDLKALFGDYLTVAAAAGLRIPRDAYQAALVAQVTVVLSTFAWTGEL